MGYVPGAVPVALPALFLWHGFEETEALWVEDLAQVNTLLFLILGLEPRTLWMSNKHSVSELRLIN